MTAPLRPPGPVSIGVPTESSPPQPTARPVAAEHRAARKWLARVMVPLTCPHSVSNASAGIFRYHSSARTTHLSVLLEAPKWITGLGGYVQPGGPWASQRIALDYVNSLRPQRWTPATAFEWPSMIAVKVSDRTFPKTLSLATAWEISR
jgi:hypothetical protein